MRYVTVSLRGVEDPDQEISAFAIPLEDLLRHVEMFVLPDECPHVPPCPWHHKDAVYEAHFERIDSDGTVVVIGSLRHTD
jgi:hypothetical protein